MKSNLTRSNAKRNVVDSMRNAKTKDSCRRVCRDTQEGIPKRIYLERISRSYSFPLLAYSRSCPIVFPFPLLHSRSLSCMRTCHNFCDRYYKPTETNLFFFKQYAATVSPNIDRSSCVHVIELECTRNLVSRYKCQIILVTFLDALLYDNAIYGEEETKGTV